MTYFTNCQTPDEARAEYRTLAKANHPDLGGDTATMQRINDAYHALLSSWNGREFATGANSTREAYTYRYDQATEQEVMDKLDELLRTIPAEAAVDFTIVGSWIWVTGDTKPVKDALKAAGCNWHSKRVCWYWRPDGYRSSYAKSRSLQDILDSGRRVERTREERKEREALTA